MPSSAAAFDASNFDPDYLHDAALALAGRGMFGVIWLDPALTIVGSAGAVPAAVVAGIPVTDALLPLVGLEDDIRGLRRLGPERSVRIPNTAVVSADGKLSPRMNVTVFWCPDRERYLVLLGATLSEASSTTELDQEIRRRRLYEQALGDKSAELQRINEQLEQFAYVISHDLNAPLRALRYLSSDIQQALADTSAADLPAVERAAAAIATQTRRMSKMLVDLLEYARIGRVQEAVETVDTRALIADILTSIAPSTTLTLTTSGTWPELQTAVAPLDLVLRNLVENAVKHHDSPHGRVEVSAELHARDVVFRVIDDGRGIPAEWQEAIFEPFRKIDDAHHPESSGIGLALVKKTVTSLGGAISVYSDAPARRGTTFTVRWPLKLAAQVADAYV